MNKDQDHLAAAPEQRGELPEPAAWEGTEGWEALAWHLCADENGEDACNELVWEGGPIPEPWGDRWLKYEGEAKRMIELVGKYAGADQLRTAIAAERERVRLEHARELFEAHREAFVGNIEALSKLDLDAMNAQSLLMAVQNWDISTGRASELLRCWVLGTFKPDMLPECGDELFAEADEPRDAWAKLQAELSTLRQQLAEAVRERDALRSVVQSALNNNGGPIDADSTLDGKSYVMVLREDFDAIDAASRVAGT